MKKRARRLLLEPRPEAIRMGLAKEGQRALLVGLGETLGMLRLRRRGRQAVEEWHGAFWKVVGYGYERVESR